ncbi:MAG TPA: hypothetical protein PLI99_01230 [archaeon]|nr:hypothetical protein [archaeon]
MQGIISILKESIFVTKEKLSNKKKLKELNFFNLGLYDLGNLHTSNHYNYWLYSHNEMLNAYVERKYLSSCLLGMYSIESFIKMFLCTKTETREIELLDKKNLYFSDLILWATKYEEFKDLKEDLNHLNLLRNKLLFHTNSKVLMEFQCGVSDKKFKDISNPHNYYYSRSDGEEFEPFWCKYINENFKNLNSRLLEDISKIESTIEKKILEKHPEHKKEFGKKPCILNDRKIDTDNLFSGPINDSDNPHIQDILTKKNKKKRMNFK